jgi:hypothetical protein
MAVAVLEIQREMNAVAIITPSTSRRGLVPTREMMARAIRRCRFQRSIAPAIRKPPRKRKITRSA